MASNPPLLSDYLTGVRRLLHDATGNYWADAELVDNINTARFRVVADTGCNRVLQTVPLLTGIETYAYSTLPSGINTFDVLNVTVLWSNMRVPLNYMPFTEFNRNVRNLVSYQGRPVVFTVYGNNTVYVGPIPDQAYSSEWDTVVAPATLVNFTDQDTISFPFTDPIPYYAAYLAKEKEQSTEDSSRFLQAYNQKVFAALRSSFTRRISQPFQ